MIVLAAMDDVEREEREQDSLGASERLSSKQTLVFRTSMD